MAKQEELKEWSKETVDCYLDQVKKVGEDVATSFYNQSDLSRVKDCELMIIGINPGAGCLFSHWNLKDSITDDFLYYGNPCFRKEDGSVMSDKEILFGYYEQYDSQKRKYGWDLMKKIHKMLNFSGKGDILKNLDRFVLSNMLFFGTYKENQIPKGIDKIECAKQTLKLIDIINPKVILLLGDQCRFLFEKTTKITHMETFVPNYHVFYSFYKNHHFIAIYHTAYYRFYTNENMKIIGNIIGYAIDNPSQRIDKEQLEKFLIEKMNHCDYNSILKEKSNSLEKELGLKNRAKLLKAIISNYGARQRIYSGTVLYHEYYTTIINGEYADSKDMIAIDLMPEENKSQYAVIVFTRQKDETKTQNLIKGVWPDEEFNPWSKDKSRHVHKVISFNESNERIKDIMEQVLQDVKAYRDKTFPLKK